MDMQQQPECRVPERKEHLHMMHIPPRMAEAERGRWVVEEDRSHLGFKGGKQFPGYSSNALSEPHGIDDIGIWP